MSRLLAVMVVGLAALLCGPAFNPARAQGLSRLSVEGRSLVDESGEPVLLRGCNVGNWLLTETWMLGLDEAVFPDQATFVSILVSRFGQAEADRLMSIKRDGWFTQRDADLIASFGFNAIRVPISYRLFERDDNPFGALDDGFDRLDELFRMANTAGLYVILDMHEAPGGQSLDQPSGDRTANGLWFNDLNKERLAWLWQRIARRYKNEPAFAGYDLLNEPYGDFQTDYSDELVEIVGRCVEAIRLIDPDRVIFAPGSLQGIEFYGDPAARGWSGVGFTEHYYDGVFTGDDRTMGTQSRLAEGGLGFAAEWSVATASPFLLGEFNPLWESAGGPFATRGLYDAAASLGLHAFVWAYKRIEPAGGIGPDNWTLVANAQPWSLPDIRTASKASIESALASLATMPLAVDQELVDALSSADPTPLPAVDPAWFAPASSGGVPGWTGTDIGAGVLPGGEGLAAGLEFDVTAGGLDIAGSRDSFRFVHSSIGPAFFASAALMQVDSQASFAQVGVMARASTGDNAAHLFLGVFPDGRVFVKSRPTTGAGTTQRIIATRTLPVGLAVGRVGGSLQLWLTDVDGVWEQVPVSESVSLGGSPVVGLAVCGNDTRVMTRAMFRSPSVTVQPLVPPTVEQPSPAANLAGNGSFEIGGGSTASGWTIEGERLGRETGWTPVRDGSALLAYRHWQVSGSSPSSASQVVTGLTPGERYELSVFVNRDAVPGGASNAESVVLSVETTGSPARVIERLVFPVSQIETGSAFSRLGIAFGAIGPEARVRITCVPHSGGLARDGAVKFDEVVVGALAR
ncbi:MAG: glycoside hydrolase family 5 protein [Phycisphaerales bacterium]